MRSDLKTFRVNGHYLIGASLEERVIVLHPDARSVAYDVDFQADSGDQFSLSENGEFVAAAFAFENFCSVEVVDLRPNAIVSSDLREDATILRVDRVHAVDVVLAPSGRLMCCTFTRKPGAHLVTVPEGAMQKVPNSACPTNGAWLTDRAILPCFRGTGGFIISYEPLAVRSTDLPSKKNVWRLIAHPSSETVAMMDAKGYVASLRADTLEPIWRRRIPEAGGWISYSGDGRFVAVQESEYTERFKAITILDSQSGKEVRRVTERELATHPLDGPRFLCYSGRFLNAETGTFEEGVSTREFWKATLAWQSKATGNPPANPQPTANPDETQPDGPPQT